MSSITPYIAPLLVFGLVVFVHELGHFLAAKLTGVYAPVFSLGWGTRLFGVRRGETDYRVSLIPLGGFVRMASRDDESMAGIEGGTDRGSLAAAAERPADVAPALWDADSMAPFGPKAVPADRRVENKSTSARVFILSAGVIMNILLTLVVSTGIYYRAGNTYVPAVIDSVVPGAPAAIAGLTGGDRIVGINGHPIRAWDEVLDEVAPVTTGTLSVEIQRGAARFTKELTPQTAVIDDPVTGAKKTVGRIGIQVRAETVNEKLSFVAAMSAGGDATWRMATSVASVLGGLASGQVSAKNLGGPIQIARTSVQAAKRGPETLWSLIAFLSLNIAILNLVPIPVLDGGQILMVLAERIKGSAFSGRVREGFARVGVLAVLALIVLVTFNDLRNLFTK
ncbi:RIP metalloprotease RseP [Gemmatimonas groenlandica]|uniref:Zinc metalloprotease n=1 Tax=Gemmatimonas groenlandica TaxID=2732249 RepID=A0A6M4IMC4_9BACT|nr:RIP metalloprotease RseP [Gemmatimonas groenlandica]QJR34949.1 RIP metalloprotease RseP [Gemmatimonas groenlandica]